MYLPASPANSQMILLCIRQRTVTPIGQGIRPSLLQTVAPYQKARTCKWGHQSLGGARLFTPNCMPLCPTASAMWVP